MVATMVQERVAASLEHVVDQAMIAWIPVIVTEFVGLVVPLMHVLMLHALLMGVHVKAASTVLIMAVVLLAHVAKRAMIVKILVTVTECVACRVS